MKDKVARSKFSFMLVTCNTIIYYLFWLNAYSEINQFSKALITICNYSECLGNFDTISN